MNTKNTETYREYCDWQLKVFLNSPFLNHDPFEQDEADVILGAMERSARMTMAGNGYLEHTRQFCSLMKMEGVHTSVYCSGKYGEDTFVEEVQLSPLAAESCEPLLIPFNHFEYPMVLDKGRYEAFKEEAAKLASTLDDRHDREYIEQSGNRIIIMSYFVGGITKFNQRRPCFRLVSTDRELLGATLRTEIIKAQHLAISYLSKYPLYCRPYLPELHLNAETEQGIMEECLKPYSSIIREKRDLIQNRYQRYAR